MTADPKNDSRCRCGPKTLPSQQTGAKTTASGNTSKKLRTKNIAAKSKKTAASSANCMLAMAREELNPMNAIPKCKRDAQAA